MNENVSLPKLQCGKCGHKWTPRLSLKPRICPRCKSPKWNENASKTGKKEKQ